MLCHVKDVDVNAVVDVTCHLHIDLHQVECHAVILQWRCVGMTCAVFCACRY